MTNDFITNLTSSLSTRFGSLLPKVLGALLVIIIGFFIAKLIKKLVERLLRGTSLDEKIAAKLQTSFRIDQFVAKLVYYLVVIYTLLISLNMLGVEGVLEPLQNMLNKFTGFIPNILVGGIIAFAGYMIASIVSEMTGFLSARLEGLSERIGFNSGTLSLSKIVKQIVFVIVFIPILIVALDALKMEAISKPATEMLGTLLNAIPRIIAAVVLLGVFYIVGKYVISIVTELLRNLGLDNFASNMGLESVLGKTSLSGLIGKLAMFFIMFTGIIAAADKLELGQVQVILNDVFHIAGKVFFGIIILLAGMAISKIATRILENSGNNGLFVPIAKFAIMGIFLAFALSTMGIAENIVNLAFGLTLGAIAVAFALSFGLGGREAAGKQMENFFNNLNKKK